MDEKRISKEKNDDQNVFELLSFLPTLAIIAEQLKKFENLAKQRTQLRTLYPSVISGNDYPFKFDGAESIYVDNVTNANAVTLQFDNEPLQFQIAANSGRFLPCGGSKQFRINGTIGAATPVNVMLLNRPMSYN